MSPQSFQFFQNKAIFYCNELSYLTVSIYHLRYENEGLSCHNIVILRYINVRRLTHLT